MTKGQRIKELLDRSGMSRTDFAAKIGASKQTVYKYENDIVTNIPSDMVEKICHVLNVSPGYLMGWEDSPEGTAANDHDLKEFGRKLAIDAFHNQELKKYFDKLNDVGKQHVINYAKDLCETTKYTSFPDSNSESIA